MNTIKVNQIYSNGKNKPISKIKEEILKKMGLGIMYSFAGSPTFDQCNKADKISFEIDQQYDCNLRHQEYKILNS